MITVFFVLLVLIVCVGWLYYRYPFLSFASLAVYSMITASVSLAYLEGEPSFISETGVYSSDIQAFWRHIVYASVVLLFAVIGGRMMLRNKRLADTGEYRVRSRSLNLYFYLALGLLTLQLINILASGMAFTGDRHGLWSRVPLPILRDVLGVLVAFVPFYAGALIARAMLREDGALIRRGLILFVYYLFYMLASSQGFHGLLLGGIMFGAPAYVTLVRYNKLPARNIVSMGALFVVVILIYGMQGMDDRGISQFADGDLVGTTLYRILVLQGGVYFTSDLYTLTNIQSASVDLLLGDMSILLTTLLDPAAAQAYMNRGVNLAGSLPGSAVLVFGYWGAVPVLALYGVILGALCALFVRGVESGYPPVLFLISYLIIWSNSAYTRGSFNPLLDIKFMVALALVVILLLRLNSQVIKQRVREAQSAPDA